MIYLGIDPGASGAIAAIEKNGDSVTQDFCKLSETPRDVIEWICDTCIVAGLNEAVARIEKVNAFPGQGVSSSFKFGQSFGWLIGVLDSMRIPYEFVTPQRWQKAMGCLTGGDKNVSKAAAQRLWPQLKITHANADALLIAEYCRRTVI